jgi:hypothetical protein
MQFILFVINRNLANAIQTNHKGITTGLMAADFFSLVKRKQCDTQRIILC